MKNRTLQRIDKFALSRAASLINNTVFALQSEMQAVLFQRDITTRWLMHHGFIAALYEVERLSIPRIVRCAKNILSTGGE